MNKSKVKKTVTDNTLRTEQLNQYCSIRNQINQFVAKKSCTKMCSFNDVRFKPVVMANIYFQAANSFRCTKSTNYLDAPRKRRLILHTRDDIPGEVVNN